jgi:DNA-binding MarR family transcriptional regulator
LRRRGGFFITPLPLPREGGQGDRLLNKLDEPATGRQLHIIALLCMKLRIKELLEERAMTKGQAGKLIRRLVSERR